MEDKEKLCHDLLEIKRLTDQKKQLQIFCEENIEVLIDKAMTRRGLKETIYPFYEEKPEKKETLVIEEPVILNDAKKVLEKDKKTAKIARIATLFVAIYIIHLFTPLNLFKTSNSILRVINFVLASLAFLVYLPLFFLGGWELLMPLDYSEKKVEEENKKNEAAIKEYETKKQKKEEIELWNKNEYPKLLEEYNEQYRKYTERVQEIKNKNKENKEKIRLSILEEKEKSKKELELINKELIQYEGLISEDLVSDIDAIVEILKYGRADTLKEAINTLFQDKQKARKFLKEQEQIERKIEEIIRRYGEEERRRNAEQEAEQRARQHEEWERQKERSRREEEERERRNEENRHNREMERIREAEIEQSERNTKTLALCTGCPKVAHCWHMGKWMTTCPKR